MPPVPLFPPEHHPKKMCVIVWRYTGDAGRADAVFKLIRTFSPPAMDFAGLLPFPALQSLFDGQYPPSLQWYCKANFFNEITDEAIDRQMTNARTLPSPHPTMHLYPVDGAAHRVATGDTAWSFRDANFAEVIVGVDPDPTNTPRLLAGARAYWSEPHPLSAGGGYVNMMMDEEDETVKAACLDNYARLAKIKKAVAPENLSRINPHIKPS